MATHFSLFFFLCLVSSATLSLAQDEEGDIDKQGALKWKIAGIFLILLSSTLGILIPIIGKRWPFLSPEKDYFFILKAFAAGVILATGFIHILPEAFERLSGLEFSPWQDFPFAGFVAMVAAIVTLIIDSTASGYFHRALMKKASPEGNMAKDEEMAGHQSHGFDNKGESDLIRHRIISQVLELGIVVHSVIVGISLGASLSPSTLRPLVAALCFHQFFEGIGLGGCIVQGKFKTKSTIIMAIFFCTTMPAGIGVGIGIMSGYDAESTTALIVEGVLDAAAAGILVYMSLVDLLAADFLSHRLQKNGRLQVVCYISLLLGAGAMSLVGKWA